jgi:hypothetical protein
LVGGGDDQMELVWPDLVPNAREVQGPIGLCHAQDLAVEMLGFGQIGDVEGDVEELLDLHGVENFEWRILNGEF